METIQTIVMEKKRIMKKTIIIVSIILTSLLGVVLLLNHLFLGQPLSEVLTSDPRNSGINISAHYANYINPSILVINIKGVSGEKSAADVFRVLLQYSARIKDKDFETVKLDSKGKTKFILKGDYFKTIGSEYGSQNPVYTMRTFPENVYKPDGSLAFEKWSGGLLGVVNKQMEDFLEFQKQWYIEDMVK